METCASTNHIGRALRKHRVGPRLLIERTESFGRKWTRSHVYVDYLSSQPILSMITTAKKHAVDFREFLCEFFDNLTVADSRGEGCKKGGHLPH